MILVTGSSGMLGRALCGALKKSRPVVGLSRRGGEGSERCDLSDLQDLSKFFDAHKPELVIHTAAYSDVDGCERDPKLAYDSNALAPKNLSQICGAKSIPWIHVSTDYVFDGRKRSPYIEEDPTGPVNIYGMTKWIGEFYAQNSTAPCVTVRTSWLFGAGNPANFVNAVLAKLKSENTVSVLDDQTDAPTSVQDLSAALTVISDFMLREVKKTGKRWNETVHVCNEGGTTRFEMTQKIKEFIGSQARVERTTRIPGRPALRPRYAVMSSARFTKFSGMKMRPWQDALKEYVQSP